MSGGNITIEKTLPNSIESERAVLGAIILDHKAIFPATEVLTVEDFYLEGHREIFRAMLALAEEETSIDLFTLREELRRRSKEEAAGGPAYIASLTDGLPSGLNVGHYAKTVREKATARQLIQLSNELMCRCYEGEERSAATLEKTESRIFQIAAGEIRGGFQPARELADAAYKEIEESAKHKGPVAGIDTGFTELNLTEPNRTEQTRNGTVTEPALSRTPEVLVEIYKAENHKLPQVLEFGPERRDKCNRRLARDPQKFIDQFTRAVIKAQETPFLCGEGDRGWKADFDWLIANDRNVIRVLEGRYDTGARASPGNAGATVFDKIRKEREERNHGSDRVA